MLMILQTSWRSWRDELWINRWAGCGFFQSREPEVGMTRVLWVLMEDWKKHVSSLLVASKNWVRFATKCGCNTAEKNSGFTYNNLRPGCGYYWLLQNLERKIVLSISRETDCSMAVHRFWHLAVKVLNCSKRFDFRIRQLLFIPIGKFCW